jgi:hypothetical protein
MQRAVIVRRNRASSAADRAPGAIPASGAADRGGRPFRRASISEVAGAMSEAPVIGAAAPRRRSRRACPAVRHAAVAHGGVTEMEQKKLEPTHGRPPNPQAEAGTAPAGRKAKNAPP